VFQGQKSLVRRVRDGEELSVLRDVGCLRVPVEAAVMTIYATMHDQLAAAQEALDRHATSSATGLCITCGLTGPCCRRETALALFSRFSRMPTRTPGLARPELIGARRITVGQTSVR
jgi:hypothetical protein